MPCLEIEETEIGYCASWSASLSKALCLQSDICTQRCRHDINQTANRSV